MEVIETRFQEGGAGMHQGVEYELAVGLVRFFARRYDDHPGAVLLVSYSQGPGARNIFRSTPSHLLGFWNVVGFLKGFSGSVRILLPTGFATLP